MRGRPRLIFVIDVYVPLGYAVWVPYAAAIAAASAGGDIWLTIWATVASCVFTVVDPLANASGNVRAGLVNRAVGTTTLIACGLIGLWQQRRRLLLSTELEGRKMSTESDHAEWQLMKQREAERRHAERMDALDPQYVHIASSPAVPNAPDGATILVVEGAEQLRDMIREVLESEGYAVISCSDGLMALATGCTHPGRIDLLLCDVSVSGVTAQQAATALRAVRPEMGVLYLTDTPALPTEAGPTAVYLLKPFRLDALVEWSCGNEATSLLDEGLTGLSAAGPNIRSSGVFGLGQTRRVASSARIPCAPARVAGPPRLAGRFSGSCSWHSHCSSERRHALRTSTSPDTRRTHRRGGNDPQRPGHDRELRNRRAHAVLQRGDEAAGRVLLQRRPLQHRQGRDSAHRRPRAHRRRPRHVLDTAPFDAATIKSHRRADPDHAASTTPGPSNLTSGPPPRFRFSPVSAVPGLGGDHVTPEPRR